MRLKHRLLSRATIGCLALPLATVVGQGSSAPVARTVNQGHATARPSATVSLSTGAIKMDGKLDEEAWQRATPVTEFTEFDPDEGRPARNRTEIRFLVDGEALYIGARMFDSLGAKGVTSRLTRRDQATSPGTDWLQFIFDTYHDHVGRSWFEVNPSGAKDDIDGVSGGGDASWDPVWIAATSIDSLGWVAELRIPFSQLRFPKDSVETWGLQIRRYTNRTNAMDQWAFWGKKDPGGPPFFGHLENVHVPLHAQQLELLPYVVQRAAYVKPFAPGDPFNDGSKLATRFGGDLKYRLSSNFLLNATFNPDFGQVEVDPAVVNLSAFETSFPEKRPFFIEGAGVFSFGGFSCFFCSNVSSLSPFYSRRIGRQPQGSISGDFIDRPENTTILGAAKITGRTKGGMTMGFLDAVTRREFAHAIAGTTSSEAEVEPLSNYFVGRGKKDFDRGRIVMGLIGTSMVRRLDDVALTNRLSKHSEQLGSDFTWASKARTYSFNGKMLFTNVDGSAPAIARLQRSSARYFQRPDRENNRGGLFSNGFDTTATAMRGYGGYGRFAKESGEWLFEGLTNFRSPGYENNDIAFTTRSDYMWFGSNVVKQWTKPGSWYRNIWLDVGGQTQYNYSGDHTDQQEQIFFQSQTPQFWSYSGFYMHRPIVSDDRMTRGGPVVLRPGFHLVNVGVNTDSRKRVSFSFGGDKSESIGSNGSNWDIFTSAELRPAANVSVSMGPSFNVSNDGRQYVRAVTDPTATTFFGTRYIFADLDQRTLAMDTRVNWTVSPAMTFQLYLQPLIASGAYDNFQEYTAPRTNSMRVFGRDAGTVTTSGTGDSKTFTIDPDGAGPASSFTVSNPDFNFRSLRGNAVFRWEYRPGSTLFLVWTQQRQGQVSVGDFDLGRDRAALFDAHPDNIFLVKLNYWLGL